MSVLCSSEDDEEQIPEGMPPKVVEVYRSVGKIMSRYKAGKVPKAFKIIPNLKQWEEVGPPASTSLNLSENMPCVIAGTHKTSSTCIL